MQIHILLKGLEPRAGVSIGRDFQRGAEVEFADANARRAKSAECVGCFFVLHSEMARVVIHAKMRIKPRIIGMFRAQLLEKRNRLRAGFKIAERLRLQAEVQCLPRALAQCGDVFHAFPEIVANGLFLRGLGDEFLERARQRAHTPLHAFGHKRGNQIKKSVGVFEAFRRSPVRHINLFLHSCAVKITKGKTVDREHVAIFIGQPLLEISKCCRRAQLPRGHFAEPQPDGVRLPSRHGIAHGQRVNLQRLKRLRPIFSAMNVGAVSEM